MTEIEVECPSCGDLVPAENACNKCGSYLPEVRPPVPTGSAPAVDARPSQETSSGQAPLDDFVVDGDQFGEASAMAALSAGWDSVPQPSPALRAKSTESLSADAEAPQRPLARPTGGSPVADGTASSATPPQGVRWQLRLSSPDAHVDIAEGAGIVLGQASPSPIWDHPAVSGYVSRNHARVWVEGGQLFIKDLGSTNGTWVGMVRLQPGVPPPLRTGDVIQLTRDNPVRLEVVR